MPLKLPSFSFLSNETVKKALIEVAILSTAGLVCTVGSTLIVRKFTAPKTANEPVAEATEPAHESESHSSEGKKEEKPAHKAEGEKKKGKEEGKEGGKEGEGSASSGLHVALKPVIVNLADSTARRYAKVTFTLDMKNDKVKDELEAVEPQVYDTLIKVLGNYRFEEVSSSSGKDAMKEEVKNRLNLVLKDGLANVFITEMIIQ